MSTTDNVLLIILTSLLSVLILLVILIAITTFNILLKAQAILKKTELVVDSVESASQLLKNTKGRFMIFKLIRNIIKISKKSWLRKLAK